MPKFQYMSVVCCEPAILQAAVEKAEEWRAWASDHFGKAVFLEENLEQQENAVTISCRA
jgi:hypothetical protein